MDRFKILVRKAVWEFMSGTFGVFWKRDLNFFLTDNVAGTPLLRNLITWEIEKFSKLRQLPPLAQLKFIWNRIIKTFLTNFPYSKTFETFLLLKYWHLFYCWLNHCIQANIRWSRVNKHLAHKRIYLTFTYYILNIFIFSAGLWNYYFSKLR